MLDVRITISIIDFCNPLMHLNRKGIYSPGGDLHIEGAGMVHSFHSGSASYDKKYSKIDQTQEKLTDTVFQTR